MAVGLLRGRAPHGVGRRLGGRRVLRRARRSRRPEPGRCSCSSTNTWNAYNDVGGTNLYTGGTHAVLRAADRARLPAQARRSGQPGRRPRPARPDDARRTSTTCSTTRLSRVVRLGRLAGLGAAVRALGRGGRDTSSTTPSTPTCSSCPDLLDGRRLYLSVGHDEYWSWEHARRGRGASSPRAATPRS